MKLKSTVILWIIYALLAFPSFYFCVQIWQSTFWNKRFFSYYKLYKNWDIGNIEAPFNMRLVSSFFVYIFNKIGFHYDTKTAFDQFPLDKSVFFNAILFNYLCIVSTCVVIFYTIKKQFKNVLLSFIAGLIYLLGFGTLFYQFMPITDAFSILLFSIIVHFYLDKNYFIIIPLVLLILQREYIYLALGLIAVLDYFKYRHKYFIYTLLFCSVGFLIYFLLRKTYFYTATFDYQASPTFFLDSLFKLKFPLLPFIKQTLITLNIFILYCGLLLYKIYNKFIIDKFNVIKLFLLLLQIILIDIAAVFGNNAGRYFYILIPLVIYNLIYELNPVLQKILK